MANSFDQKQKLITVWWWGGEVIEEVLEKNLSFFFQITYQP